MLVTGCADNHVRAFALPEGKPLWDLEAHAEWVFGLAMSADGKHVASASRDRTAKVFDVKTGTVEGTFTDHVVPVLSIAFSLDSTQLISGGADGEVRRCKLNGEGIKDTTLRPGGRTQVLGLGFLQSETPLAVLGNGLVTTMDAKSRKGKDQITHHNDRVNAVLISGNPEQRRIISASHDGQVRVTELIRVERDGKPAQDIREVAKFLASPGW